VCTLKYKGNMTLGVESKLQLQVVGALNVNITISVQEITAKVRAPSRRAPSAEREALTALVGISPRADAHRRASKSSPRTGPTLASPCWSSRPSS